MSCISIFRAEIPVRYLTTLTVVLTICFAGLQASAQQNDRPTSLDIVPRSASFYLASMNHAAQYKAVVESNAYKQLMDCDVARRMRKAYRSGRRRGFGQFGYGNPFGQYLETYAQSVGSVPGKMAINYLGDIFGNEVFVYGDQDWIEMSRAIGEFYKEAGATMEDIELDDMDEATIRKLLQIGARHLADVNTPKLVIGTVLDSPGGTKSLLQIAEAGIDQLMTQIPEQLDYVIDGYEVIEEDDLYMLSFQLNSEMMPWDEVEDDPEIGPYLDDIKAIVANKTINISLGVKGKYLIFSIGPNADHIKNLGQGDLLIGHPKLEPLKTAAAKHPITSVRYTSEAMAAYSHESIPGMVDTFLSFAKVGLQSAPPQVQEDLAGLTDDLSMDAEELKTDLMASLSKPGTYLGFSYMAKNGIDGVVYNWAENRYLDDSGPLTILDYVGAHPTMFVASRDAGSREQYVMARKWMARVYDRVTTYVPRTAPSQQDALMFVEISRELRDILSRVADSTSENLLDATQKGQLAIVMDFSTAKKTWHETMPPSEFELPIPSVAALVEHHDKQKIVAAGSSYLQAVVDFSEVIRELPESNMPDEFHIPQPLKKSAFGGDLYYYELPAQAGVDVSIAPHALVRDDLLVLGYSLDQTERLLAGDKPSIKGLLADRSNLMAASYFNHRELVDALHIWLKYGVAVARESGETIELDQDVENDTLAFREPELMEALDHIVALARCLESVSSMSYMQDGAQVTRYQIRFQDVPEN